MSNVDRAAATKSNMKLFVFDCGVIEGVTPSEFGFDHGQVPTELATPCYLIVHPRGTLMWDTGEIPDEEFEKDGSTTRKRAFRAERRLRDQLSEVGYKPEDIDFLALSHFHNDHTANANMFCDSTWLVQRAEFDAMFDPKPDFERYGPITPDISLFHKLKGSKKIIVENTDHDVFGDGKVVIKFTPGHTAGHQSLFVDLEEEGPIIITGDLYHYYAEVGLDADFVNHLSNPETSVSRRKIEAFAEHNSAELWIPHDIGRNKLFRKSPDFYA